MTQTTDETTETVTVAAGTTSGADVAAPLQPESDGGESAEASVDTTVSVQEDGTDAGAPPHEEKQVRTESDRSEEIPNLLGGSAGSTTEEDDAEPDGNGADDIAEPLEIASAEPSDAPADACMPDEITPSPDPEPSATACLAPLDEIRSTLASMHSALAETHARIDAVTQSSGGLADSINTLSHSHQMLTAQLDTFSSDTSTKGVLSKTFLVISSVLVSILVIFQLFTFYSLTKVQKQQNTVGATVFKNMTSLDKKMAEYDKNIAKILTTHTPPEHAPAAPTVGGIPGHETAGTVVGAPAHGAAAPVIPVAEKINRLRNGLPEKQLIRKETGDWFVYNKKGNECISDVEVIQALNEAYRRVGRTLETKVPMPPHNALCILKPDGKGGTAIVMTKDFLP